MTDGTDNANTYPSLTGAIVALALFFAVPLVVWLLAPTDTQPPTGPSPQVVLGGAFLIGFVLGCLYQLVQAVRRSRQPPRNREPWRRSSFGFWQAVSAVALAQIAAVAVPEVAGIRLGLVGPIFGFGLLLPGVPGFVERVAYYERERRKDKATKRLG